MLALRRSFSPWFWRRTPALRDIDREFEAFLNDFGRLSLSPGAEFDQVFKPSLDVSETEQAIKVSVELPGLAEQDIQVSLANDVLTISGEKKAEQEEKGENYHRVERSYGAFRRSIAVPAEVEADQVEATFKNGLLTVTLPKSAAAQAEVKKIEVKAG